MKVVSKAKIIITGFAVMLIIGLWTFGFKPDPVSGIPILAYHKVEDNSSNPLALSSQEFDEQMAYLARYGFNAISPDQLLNYLQQGLPLPDKPVLITFDDGYQDNYRTAYPIMKKHGLTATVFLITDRIGQDEWYMTWDQVEEMRRNGFSFGSHTLSHTSLSTVSDDYVMFQLVKSREGAEWRLDAPVKYFAYPSGRYNENVEKLVRQAGYRAAFSVEFGRAGRDSTIYSLERIPLMRSRWSFFDFYVRLNFTSIVEVLKNTKDALGRI